MTHLPAQRIAVAGVAGIVTLGVAGVLHAAGAAPEAFDLDAEYTVPAVFSGGLLLLAGGMALALARSARGVDRLLLLVITAALAFLGCDELFSIHERLDIRTDVDWQILYVPAGAAFAWAIWRVTGALGRRGPEAQMIFAGLAAWAVAQALEAAAYSEVFPSLVDPERMSAAEIDEVTHSVGYYAMSIPEELLEMGGSLLLAVALARAVSRARAASH